MATSSATASPLLPTPPTRAILLSDWAPIRVSGPDADNFLQAQLSSDLRLLTPLRAQWSSWSSPKGRMLALLLLLRDAEGTVDLWMPAALIEPILKRLRMFVLRSKVVLQDGRAQRAALGVLGCAPSSWLSERKLAVPSESMSVGLAGELQVLRVQGSAPRFLVCGPAADLAALGPETLPDAALAWRAADIQAGVPVIHPQTQDRWVAQMVNLDLLGGISFDKGCYTGQEVVARLHYLGNLKKRMFLLHGTAPAPEPGTEIFDAMGDHQAVGDIVDAVALGTEFIASAVLQLSRRESDSLRLGSPGGPALSRPLAYAGPRY